MEIKAFGGNILKSNAQGILMVLVSGKDNICMKVGLPVVLVPGLNIYIYILSVAAAPKGVKTVITKECSYLDLI